MNAGIPPGAYPPPGYYYPPPGYYYPPPGYYYPPPPPPPPSTPPGYLRRERWILLVLAVLAVGLSIAGLIVGGFLASFAGAGLSLAPFLGVGWLAHMGVRRLWARALAWTGVVLLLLIVGAGVVGLSIEAYPPSAQRTGVLVAVGVAALVSGLAVWPLGGAVLRRLGMRPDDPAHRVALVLAVGLTAACLAPLVGSGGRAILIDLIVRHAAEHTGPVERESIVDTLLPLVWIIPGSFVLVGYGVHRGGALCRERLGLRWPGWRALALGLGVGLALVPLALGLDVALGHLLDAIGLPRTDGDQVERLFDIPKMTLASSVAIALAAGIGEELLVRGVLQPRLGLVCANLMFAAAHALQYATDGVVVVFLLGLVFGVLRRRAGTITGMAAHASYDLALFVMVVLG